MASRRLEERVPLLSDEELPEDDLGGIDVLYRHQSDARRAPQALDDESSRPSADYAALSSHEEDSEPRGEGKRKRKHYSGNEMIVAVFVVQFDIRKGIYIHVAIEYTRVHSSHAELSRQ